MKLIKISEPNSSIEIYKVQQPSKAYKKLFPKRFVFALQFGNNSKVITGNENILPLTATFKACVGYIFTTQNLKLSSELQSSSNFGNTFPVNLNQYFITDSDDYDLILEITPNNLASPKFNESVILRMKSEEVLNSNNKDFAKNVLKIVSDEFKEKITIESFILKIINTFPLNFFGFPINYPKCINQNVINSQIKLKHLFVAYDFRPTKEITHNEEVEVITKLEDSFEDENYIIEIKNNYNNIVEKLEKVSNEQKIKYEIKDNIINFRLKDFRKLSFDWDFTDLI